MCLVEETFACLLRSFIIDPWLLSPASRMPVSVRNELGTFTDVIIYLVGKHCLHRHSLEAGHRTYAGEFPCLALVRISSLHWKRLGSREEAGGHGFAAPLCLPGARSLEGDGVRACGQSPVRDVVLHAELEKREETVTLTLGFGGFGDWERSRWRKGPVRGGAKQ